MKINREKIIPYIFEREKYVFEREKLVTTSFQIGLIVSSWHLRVKPNTVCVFYMIHFFSMRCATEEIVYRTSGASTAHKF